MNNEQLQWIRNMCQVSCWNLNLPEPNSNYGKAITIINCSMYKGKIRQVMLQ